MINYSVPDLSRHPPRSVRVRLGGFAHLPRLLDKARAESVGKNGPYHYYLRVTSFPEVFRHSERRAGAGAVRSGGQRS